MTRIAALTLLAGVLSLAGCAFHHDDYSGRAHRPDYVDWEPDSRHWGDHYHHGGDTLEVGHHDCCNQ